MFVINRGGGGGASEYEIPLLIGTKMLKDKDCSFVQVQDSFPKNCDHS